MGIPVIRLAGILGFHGHLPQIAVHIIYDVGFRIGDGTIMINETQRIVVNPTTNVFAFRIPLLTPKMI